ncbi:RecQ family ATP-dependent DNA helicase [Caldalkalibacillus mannanilyticus]|uniref:RecQ family ATP-dependent DNA helicase n=1 Tax=Caldalkalibacillus mannanilyticus TaxID=1418 RepID=UPI00046A14F8|nr:ATP-dependent DNA helicase RecQ [Caldalkalibacillus mannanilyticus]
MKEALIIEQERLEAILGKVYGHSSFREGQLEIIQSVLEAKDTLVIKSTGAGKSLCYQLPSLFYEGLTLVISPLISLMEDQVSEARKRGRRDVISFHSGYSLKEKELILANLRNIRLLYISPEGLNNQPLIQALKKRKVSLFVVDEAHCISQWGHDFRMEYLELAKVRSFFHNPPCLAVTATATAEVKQDIIQFLNLHQPQEFIYSVDRPTIAIKVEKVGTEREKDERILQLIQKRKDTGMIYFSSRHKAEEFTFYLHQKGIHDVAYYHGGMSTEERQMIQQQFLANELRLICATNAFGMGVNKPNIRFVIHYHFPSYLEGYVQEMGRCSRDGKEGLSYVFYQTGDEQIPYRFIEQEFLSADQIGKLMESIQLALPEQHPVMFQELTYSLECSYQALHFVAHHLEQMGVCTYQRSLQQITLNSPLKQNVEKIKEELNDMIEKQRGRRRKKIAEMYYWLTLDETSCRRSFILDYFSEQDSNKMEHDLEKPCCDLCGIAEEWIFQDIDTQQTIKQNTLVSQNNLGIQEKIDRLWPIKVSVH